MRRKKVLESWTWRVGPAEWDAEVGGMEVKALSPTAERQTETEASQDSGGKRAPQPWRSSMGLWLVET